MQPVSPEYRGARRVLLDALAALEPQLPSLILVGAQAIYLHAGQTDVGIATAPTTTDGDLAVDAELLAAEPEMTGALTAAGFSTPRNPGSWVSPDGVAIDLMVCPHQANRAGRGARSARLPPHGNRLARITRGLEPALVDHSTVRLVALDITDSRSVPLKVAGPAALVTAKLIKLQERFDDVNTAKPDRVRGKDVTDIFRLLVATESDVLQNGFAIHQQLSQAATVTDQALEFAAADRRQRSGSRLRRVFAAEVQGDSVLVAQWDALIRELG